MKFQSFIAPMSAPAAKAFSLPVITIAPIASSASKAYSARPSSCISCGLSAFICFGRLSVISATRPRVSVVMSSYAIFAMLP